MKEYCVSQLSFRRAESEINGIPAAYIAAITAEYALVIVHLVLLHHTAYTETHRTIFVTYFAIDTFISTTLQMERRIFKFIFYFASCYNKGCDPANSMTV